MVTLSKRRRVTIPVGSSKGANSVPVMTVMPGRRRCVGAPRRNGDISSTAGSNYEALTTTSAATVNVTDDADTTVVALTAKPASR